MGGSGGARNIARGDAGCAGCAAPSLDPSSAVAMGTSPPSPKRAIAEVRVGVAYLWEA